MTSPYRVWATGFIPVDLVVIMVDANEDDPHLVNRVYSPWLTGVS